MEVAATVSRVKGLKAALTQEDIEKFVTADRLRKTVKESTWKKVYRRSLTEYCNFLGKTPDEIMEDRKKTLKHPDEDVQRTHEELLMDFRRSLEERRNELNRHKKLSSNYVKTTLRAVIAFYDENYKALIKPKVPKGVVQKPTHVPTQEELGRLLKAMKPEHMMVALAQAQSGMSLAELLSIRWDTLSSAIGTVKKQVFGENKLGIVHIDFVRAKASVKFDTFFGSATMSYLRELKPDDGPLFDISRSYYEELVKEAARKAKISGDVTPHSFRKFFETQLKLLGVMRPELGHVDPDLVEHWMGHKLGGEKPSYFIPSPEMQAKIYARVQVALEPA
jgi:integrase